jgi:DNA-directed RNA polymerase subunit RPC12/RpoP
MSTKVQESHSNFSEDFQSDFCPKCGSLIELDCLMEEITCSSCKKKLSFKEFVGKHIKSHMTIQKEKDWIRKYVHSEATK